MNFPDEIYADTDLVCSEQEKFGHQKYIRADKITRHFHCTLGKLPKEDGWYYVVGPRSGDIGEFVKIGLNIEKQKYVVHAIGQNFEYSDELWRYKDWYWSERIDVTPRLELAFR